MIEHKIWKGDLYDEQPEGKRYMIIGNSHYRNPADADTDDFTKILMTAVAAREQQKYLPFFAIIQKAFNRDHKLWTEVVFLNLVPECIATADGKYKEPTDEQAARGRGRFLEALRCYQPDKIFVFSNSHKKGWRALPETDEELDRGHAGITKIPDLPPGRHFEYGSYAIRNKKMMAFGLAHPARVGKEAIPELFQAVQYALNF
ncbi:hypothetical protein [Acidipila sp. EB88]|uniref:hypothetical protein n=1 Tax=Acidipila sp. EB88 TaxID=2305226 RepID=UPI000F5EC261|nr:hypothetical protein [Acidipila sp. EB88]RRA48280.1 hypothetical protein D1Y84_08230 [Acidipila sp. EB88]